MKKKYLSIIFGMIFFIIIAYFSFIGISFFISSLIEADPKVSASIIGAMATVFVGLSVVIINQRHGKIREAEEAHRTKKVEIYEKFLKMVQSLIAGKNENLSIMAPSEEELAKYMLEFKTEILLWGAPEVIKYQLEFEEASRNSGDIFLAIDNLYKSIRKDIGLSNKNLNNLELVKMYLKNPDELDLFRSSKN